MAQFAAADSQLEDPLAVLVERSDTLFCALGDDGFRVPFPEPFPVARTRLLPVPPDRATMLDLVVQEDALTVVAAWEQVHSSGLAYASVHLRHDPERPRLLTLVDATSSHGVWIGALSNETTEFAHDESRVLPGSLSIPRRPRTASIQKTSLGVIVGIDDRTSRMLGWTEDQMVGIRSTEFMHPDDRDRAVANWLEMLSKEQSMRVRVRHATADGGWLWVECENIYSAAPDPAEVRITTQLSDISDEMATLDALDRRERLLRRVAESVPVGLLQIASDRSLVYANERIAAILGLQKAQSWEQLLATVVEADRERVNAALEEALVADAGAELEVEIVQPLTEEARVCGISLVSLSDREGVAGALLCLTDITDSVGMRKALTVKATFDGLTGCHNRSSVMAILDEAMSQSETPITAIFIDLDKFKKVNDKYGHAVGDELLIAAAARLEGALRHEDVVGRIGGDEFLIVSRGVASVDAAMALADRISAALHRPLEASPGLIEMCASVGVAYSQPGMDSTTLIQQADTAMYESKQQCQGRPVLYRSGRQKHTA